VTGVCGPAKAATMPASKVVKKNAAIGLGFILVRFCTQVDWRTYTLLAHKDWKDNRFMPGVYPVPAIEPVFLAGVPGPAKTSKRAFKSSFAGKPTMRSTTLPFLKKVSVGMA